MNRTLIPAALAALALTACGGGISASVAEPDTTAPPTTVVEPTTTERERQTRPEPEPAVEIEAGSDGEFVVWFSKHGGNDLMADAADTSHRATAAVNTSVERAARLSQDTADIWGDVYDLAYDAPAYDSEMGQLTLDAAATCRDAYQDAADALYGWDLDALDVVSDDLHDCASRLDEVTALAESYL